MAVITEEIVQRRFESPMNLFHRLRSTTKQTVIPSIPSPTADDLIPDLDKKLDIAGSKSKALSVMNKVLSRLDNEIEGIKTEKLPSVARDMATALKSMESDKEDKSPVQFLVYAPQIVSEDVFGDVIEAKE